MLPPERPECSLKCVKTVGGWGFAPDPTGGAYSAPPARLKEGRFAAADAATWNKEGRASSFYCQGHVIHPVRQTDTDICDFRRLWNTIDHTTTCAIILLLSFILNLTIVILYYWIFLLLKLSVCNLFQMLLPLLSQKLLNFIIFLLSFYLFTGQNFWYGRTPFRNICALSGRNVSQE
jgi:hypothetical protein